jgi:medium-chain acyl-[acyl-carrier-protein] hydrolase
MSTHPLTTASTGAAQRWVRLWSPRPQARLRLLCFHPAGAGTAFFRDWATLLPDDVEVLAVQLPGRESRFTEPPLTSHQEAVTALHAALRPYLTRPYALFGHSMGALLAYGVAVAAMRHGDRPPVRLFLSGSQGPGGEPRKPGRPAWTDAELVADLREMGGTPEEVLSNSDLLALVLPTLRADYALCDSFRAPAGALLDCPVSVFGGDRDAYTAADLARWGATTRGGWTQRMFDGGHFFLTAPSAEAVRAAVAADLLDG